MSLTRYVIYKFFFLISWAAFFTVDNAQKLGFEFIFIYGVRYGFNFFLLHGTIQFPQHHLSKRLFFPH
jgi:hypothetical protein